MCRLLVLGELVGALGVVCVSGMIVSCVRLGVCCWEWSEVICLYGMCDGIGGVE